VDTYHEELFEEMKTLGRSQSPLRRSRQVKRDRGEYGKIQDQSARIPEVAVRTVRQVGFNLRGMTAQTCKMIEHKEISKQISSWQVKWYVTCCFKEAKCLYPISETGGEGGVCGTDSAFGVLMTV